MIVPRLKDRTGMFKATEQCTNNATDSGEQMIELKISLLGMDITYLTTKVLSFNNRVIKTLAYYRDINEFKYIGFKAMESMKNK